MANSLKAELEGRYVILKLKFFRDREKFKDAVARMFKCKDGFGCSSDTMGRAVFGHFTIDGEEARIDGFDIQRFATDEEIEQAKHP